MPLKLRCYAYRDGEAWEAICIDLDIATFANSLEGAQASLATCIEMYLERVAELPVEEQSGFLRRRSPWRLRTKLALMTWAAVLGRSANRSRGFTFQPELPAFP